MDVGGPRTPASRVDDALDAAAGGVPEGVATISDDDEAVDDTLADPGPTPSSRPARATPVKPARAVAPHGHLGRYVLGKRLGAGGMALVYRAHDPALERELAIKVLRPRMRGEAARDRLLREAQAMARLEHANLLPVFDVGTSGDNVYLVMPYMPGGTLGQWLAAEPRPWRAVLAHFLAAGRGLVAAHAQGIIHRDFKPDNVLLGADGEVRVADFGLAHFAVHPAQSAQQPTPDPGANPPPAVASQLTRTGTVLGTPSYMAPEQLRGAGIDARSDQFSFCVALWEGLYGERPFRPETPHTRSEFESLLGAIRRGPPAPNSDRRVPRWLRAMVARGLRPDPAERWPTLELLLDRAGTRSRRPRQVAIASALGLAAAACIAAVIALCTGGDDPLLPGRAARPLAGDAAARAFRISRVTARGRVSDAAVSSDGTHLAWVVGSDVVIQTRGSVRQARVVLRDAADATLAFAPGGDRLAVTNPPGRTRIVDVGSGTVLADAAVGSPLLGFAGPDALVYSDKGTTLELRPLANLIESRQCALPGDVRSVGDLAATERGEVLLIIDRMDSSRALLRVGADCKDPVLLRVDRWLDAVAAGGERAHALRRAAGDVELAALASDGTVTEVRALDGDTGDLAGVTPAGWAYFTRTEYEWRLVEIDAAGAATERGAGAQRTELVGSPDGEWIAWVEDGDDRRALRVAPTDRMADRPAPIATGVMTVAWAHDGRRLAAILDAGGRHELVDMDLTGAIARRVPVADLDVEDWVAWLDSDAVVATSYDNRRLLRIDLATGAVESMLDQPGEVRDPQTAPDGSIVFAWDRDDRGARGVWLRAPDGKLTHLREDSDHSVHAGWAPGGGAILLFDRESGHVWRLARPGDEPARTRPVPLIPNEWMPALWPRGPGRILAHVVRRTTDLHVSRPDQ